MHFRYYFDNCTRGTRLVFTNVPVTLRHPTPRTAIMITTGCVANPGEPECRPDSRSIQTHVAAHRERLIYRIHLDRGPAKGRRKDFTEADYARLLDVAHQQLGGPIMPFWGNLNSPSAAPCAS
uniref:hypothetical protein n=1 Tax=Streptomyces ipomoeae TaxID=103232 RepID=UPI00215CBDFE|nr:hypothetical protein [Streptomyces ipomoeae]